MWRDIRHAISYMPEEMKRYDLHIDNKAYNMGIFGGTDIDFTELSHVGKLSEVREVRRKLRDKCPTF